MSQKCKNLEEKAKTLIKTEPLKAKDNLIDAARCYEKIYKKKNYEKLIGKAAKILQDYTNNLDPFEAKQFITEAAQLYNELNKKDDSKSLMINLANKFVNYGKKIEKSNLNLVNAIKYYLAAEEIFLEQDEEELYHECTISVYDVCVAIGIPLGRVSKYLKIKPS